MLKPGTLCIVTQNEPTARLQLKGRIVETVAVHVSPIYLPHCSAKSIWEVRGNMPGRWAVCECSLRPISDPDATDVTEQDVHRKADGQRYVRHRAALGRIS